MNIYLKYRVGHRYEESKLKDFVKDYEISLSKGFTSKEITSHVIVTLTP